MAGSVRQIIEVPCTVEALERSEALSQLAPEALTALGAESIDGDALGVEAAARVDAAIEACLAAYDPRGVYKLFNPAICTLPPEYSEPAIKLVGTMMMFHGQSVYERLRRAAHCALMAVTIGPDNPAALPADFREFATPTVLIDSPEAAKDWQNYKPEFDFSRPFDCRVAG